MILAGLNLRTQLSRCVCTASNIRHYVTGVFKMVNVGIIGLGETWETRYLPVLQKLRNRIRVAAVYAPVANRGRQVATVLGSDVSHGIVATTERADVQAVLVLGDSWHGNELLRLVCLRRRPVFVARCLAHNLETLQQLHETATAEGTTIMPELGWRNTPATSRLQELMATRIGRPRKILVTAVAPSHREGHLGHANANIHHVLIDWLDWCCYSFQTAPSLVWSQPRDPSDGNCLDRIIRIEFRPDHDNANRAVDAHADQHIPVAEICVRDISAETSDCEAASAQSQCEQQVHCENGTAIVRGTREISWKTGSNLITESLTSERTEVEVMLDLFCRRVAGDVIPVADLSDLCRSIKLAQATEQSFHEGGPIRFERQ